MNQLIIVDAQIAGHTERLAIETSGQDAESVQVLLLRANAKIIKVADMDTLIKNWTSSRYGPLGVRS